MKLSQIILLALTGCWCKSVNCELNSLVTVFIWSVSLLSSSGAGSVVGEMTCCPAALCALGDAEDCKKVSPCYVLLWPHVKMTLLLLNTWPICIQIWVPADMPHACIVLCITPAGYPQVDATNPNWNGSSSENQWCHWFSGVSQILCPPFYGDSLVCPSACTKFQ